MSLDLRQERYFNRFFPGLIDSIRQLDEGEFKPIPPREVKPQGKGIRHIRLLLLYRLRDRNEIEIRASLRLRAGEQPYIPGDDPVNLSAWECYRYAFHYGKTFDNCVFRYDLDDDFGYHVHMGRDRVLADQVRQNICDIDPKVFVQTVAKFRQDRVYPLKRKLS